MGDRANVKIVKDEQQVCLYTHWGGYELPGVVKKALGRGESRWSDYQYLNRIIFCEMVAGREMETTGFGISQELGDGDDRVITLDVADQTVQIKHGSAVSDYISFEDFVDSDMSW